MSDQTIHILLVEDDADDARLVQDMLLDAATGRTDRDYKLTHVERLDRALAALTEESYQVVLLDLSLPDSRGLETVHHMLDSAPQLPVVVMSGLEDERVALEAAKIGAQDYLLKGHVDKFSLPRAIDYAIERKRAQEALHTSESFLTSIIEQSPHAMWISDHEGTLVRLNQACRDLLRIEDEDVVGKYNVLKDNIVEDQGFLPLVKDVFEKGKAAQFEIKYDTSRLQHLQLKKTTFVILKVTIFPIRDSDGRVTNAVIQHVDVTRRRETERVLEQRAAQLALLNDIGRKIATLMDLDSLLDRTAQLVQSNFDYHHVALFTLNPEKDALLMRTKAGAFVSVFPPDHQIKLGDGMVGWVGLHGQTALSGDVDAESRYTNFFPDVIPTKSELSVPIQLGEQLIGVLDVQSPRLNAFDESDVIMMETLADQLAVAIENSRLYDTLRRELTERERIEEELRNRNRGLALLNRIIAASANNLEPVAILEMACHELARSFRTSHAMAMLLNKEKSEATVVAERLTDGQPSALNEKIPVVGNPLFQHLLSHKGPLPVLDAANDPRLEPIRDLVQQRSIASSLVLPLVVADEVVGSLSIDSYEPRSFLAEEVSLAWSAADQVAGALAHSNLTQTHRRLITAIEQAAESVIITDVEGTILYVNPAFERNTGYTSQEAIGHTPRILKSGEQDDTFYKELWTTISGGQVWQGRLINKKKDDTLYTEDATITPVLGENGQIVSYVGLLRDVTRELELEEQYHQAQKMEAIGRLTGGIAHDFNNLLTAMNGFAELMQFQLATDDPLQELLGKIRSSGRRAADLVGQLLAFSRKQVIQPQVLDLNGVVEDMDRMLQRIIGEDIELQTILTPDLWKVRVDPTQIEQVIVNLAVNARDAMPDGGRLLIETSNVVFDQHYVARHLEIEPGEQVLLAISDTGVGMSGEIKERIFEPFFTTKERGKGTGLGLATVFGIVKQNGGNIWCYSEEGIGTTFKVYLPRCTEEGDEPSSSQTKRDVPLGSEVVLLVEDEEEVRDLAQRILQRQGYIVLGAECGGQALELAATHTGPIHMVLTDVVLPDMSGKQLTDQLAESRPHLEALYMSGYTDETIARHGVLKPGIAFLQKPFSAIDLARKVRRVLDKEA